MSPTLLVLAAGMGSRYGGLKQIDPMGPNGETVLDYSVFDAIRAGFTRVIFIIRKDFATAFQASIGHRFLGKIQVDYAFQDITDLPPGFSVPPDREKPWGTGHAILAARHLIHGPFAVINADDFYGQDAYLRATTFLSHLPTSSTGQCAMVGYPLLNTLSDHGHVNRGICKTTPTDSLTSVEEYLNIQRDPTGLLHGDSLNGSRQPIPENAIVSMNFWVFTADFFPQLEKSFTTFLTKSGTQIKSEFYIPTVVDELIKTSETHCQVLETTSLWFGVTYPADKPVVVASIMKLITAGHYPTPLA